MSVLPCRILFHFFKASLPFLVAGKRERSILNCCWMMLVSNHDSREGILITIRPPFFMQPDKDRKNIFLSFNDGVRIALIQIPKSQGGAFFFFPLISALIYSTF